MSRRPDWPAILPRAIHAWEGREHDFKTGDCVRYGADCMAQIGVEGLIPEGLNWSTHTGALRAVRKAGGIAGVLATRLPEVPHWRALCADLIVTPPDDVLECLWIVLGGRAWTLSDGGGLQHVDLVTLLADQPGARVFSTGGAA